MPGGRVVQHGGNTFGQSAFIGFHPTKRIGAVVLSNARLNLAADITDLGYHLLDANYPLTSIRRPATVSQEALQRLVGNYQTTSGDRFRVRVELGQLAMELPASRFDFPAYPFSATHFEALAVELPARTTATFQIPNGATRARSMTWTQNGVASSYIRQPDPNRLRCVLSGTVAILSMLGEDEGEYTIQSSTDMVGWQPIGTLTGLGKTLEVQVATAPSAVFFRSVKVVPANRPALSERVEKIMIRPEPLLTPSFPQIPR